MTAPEPLIDGRHAAKLLAISYQTALRWASKGRLPHYVLGSGTRRVVRFRATELQDWLQQRRKESDGTGR